MGTLSKLTGKGLMGIAPYYLSKESRQPEAAASNEMAKIYRDQWADYKERFLPHTQTLRTLALGDADNLQAEQYARDAVNTNFNNANGMLARSRSRLGQSLGDAERMNEGRTMAIAKSAAEVDAVNKARIHAFDRDNLILSGSGASGLRQYAMRTQR